MYSISLLNKLSSYHVINLKCLQLKIYHVFIMRRKILNTFRYNLGFIMVRLCTILLNRVLTYNINYNIITI